LARRIATSIAVSGSIATICAGLFAAPVSAGGFEVSPAIPPVAVAGQQAGTDKAGARRFCKGERATIVGNRKANRIIGTTRRDVIWTGRGADTVAGQGGKDLVCGGAGADALEGNGGRDHLYGGKGQDLCTGGRREHRHHHSCEVHLDLLGHQVDPPKAPNRSTAAVATRAKPLAGQARSLPSLSAAGSAQVRAPYSTQQGGAYFASQAPVCNPDGRALTVVHMGKVFFQTYYTNPGYIAIRPAYFRYGENTGAMQGPLYDTGAWTVLNAPADGAVYEYQMNNQVVPWRDRLIWYYEVFWWDGTQWNNGTNVAVPGHYVQTTTGPVSTGALCWV